MHKIVILASLVLLATTNPARAAASFEGCSGFVDSVPATISTQGVWCLRGDLSTAISSGAAITVATNNVTLDCNQFKLGGLAAGTATNAFGVRSEQSNTTVTNCNIRGFRVGVAIEGGGGHLIEDNRFDNMRSTAISALAQGATIRGNRIFDTGGSTLFPDFAAAIISTGGIEIFDNAIQSVSAEGDNTTVLGISVSFSGSGSIWNNRIGSLSGSVNGVTYGIRVVSSTRVVLRNNDIKGRPDPGTTGLHCSNNQATAFGNVVAGFETPIVNCAVSGNFINSN